MGTQREKQPHHGGEHQNSPLELGILGVQVELCSGDRIRAKRGSKLAAALTSGVRAAGQEAYLVRDPGLALKNHGLIGGSPRGPRLVASQLGNFAAGNQISYQLKQLQAQGASYREPDAVGIDLAPGPVGASNHVLLMVGHNDAAWNDWLGKSASNGYLDNRVVYGLTCDAPSNARRNSDAIAESGAIGIGTRLVKIDPTVLPAVLIEVGALLNQTPGQPLSSDALLKKAIEQAIRHDFGDRDLVEHLTGLLNHYLLQLSVVERPGEEGTQNG